MTECERLIAEKKVPESFLAESQFDGYVISSTIKKVWAISIDLLTQVDFLCKKHNLKYFAIGGTLLGAIRHKGFIPWDDDIDIALPREDFDKFLKYASEELTEPYFLQTPLTDPSFFNRLFVRLRNSNTTAISPFDGKLECNNGIFIDIFPLDSYSPSRKNNRFIKKEKLLSAVAWNKIHFKQLKKRGIARFFSFCFSNVLLRGNISDFYKRHENKCLKISSNKLEYMGIQYSFYRGGKEKWYWKSDCFDEMAFVDFEYIKIPIPKNYETILETTYGNYLEYPPKDSWGKFHDVEFDPDTSFKVYCHKKYGVSY